MCETLTFEERTVPGKMMKHRTLKEHYRYIKSCVFGAPAKSCRCVIDLCLYALAGSRALSFTDNNLLVAIIRLVLEINI